MRNKYRSNFERSIAANLRKRGVKFQFEPHKLCYWKKKTGGVCRVCGAKDVFTKHKYLPDFLLSNGVYIEAKGKFTAPNRTKMLAVRDSNPKLDIRMLFMKDNWITTKHKHRYSDWCEKNGFEFAFMKVPEEWTK